MKGSYWAGIIESDMLREKRLKEAYSRKKYIRENCPTCANKRTDLCHIVEGIDGKLRCINYKEE